MGAGSLSCRPPVEFEDVPDSKVNFLLSVDFEVIFTIAVRCEDVSESS